VLVPSSNTDRKIDRSSVLRDTRNGKSPDPSNLLTKNLLSRNLSRRGSGACARSRSTDHRKGGAKTMKIANVDATIPAVSISKMG